MPSISILVSVVFPSLHGKYFEDACNLRILIEAVMYNDVTFYTVVCIVLPIHSELNHRLEVHINIPLLPSQEISKNGMPESFTDEAELQLPKMDCHSNIENFMNNSL